MEPGEYKSSESAVSVFWNETGLRILVCLQGVEVSDEYALTDPALLTPKGSTARSDMGQPAIDRFLGNHECGELCDLIEQAIHFKV